MISEATRKRFDELVKRYPEKRSVLIPMLHEVQAEVGHLSPEAIEWVAGYLELSPADVMSV
ncbi:MAG TPA: NAD(P)H-dependent oxidoreductase subunit E, partial [Candidatus Acidoferrum sp.]|nr:NAD(P)H-dependent oxidoreductase subunit E [Candidatus Acidoferrum sp.]